MFEPRKPTSTGAIERAIRAQLAVHHGPGSPIVVLPLPVREVPTDAEGRNWDLALDFKQLSADQIEAVLSAAEHVAEKFNASIAGIDPLS